MSWKTRLSKSPIIQPRKPVGFEMKGSLLSPGVEITCPACGDVMLRVHKAPEAGDSDLSAIFDSVGFTLPHGEVADPNFRLKCPKDETRFFRDDRGLHTAKGWIR